MNTISLSSPKFLLGGLFVGFFLFFFFIPAFQAQATIGAACGGSPVITACSPPSTCSGDKPETTAADGKCIGPCTSDGDCAALTAGGTSLGWAGSKCTGTTGSSGVCLELPRAESALKDAALTTTGAGLLGLVDLVTNWVFAIFVVLSIIFILLAAFQFVTAGGDSEKVGEARQKLIWAVVGIAIALISKGLVPVIRAIVGG